MIKIPGHDIWFQRSALHSMQIHHDPGAGAWILTLNIGLSSGPLFFPYESRLAAQAVAQILAEG